MQSQSAVAIVSNKHLVLVDSSPDLDSASALQRRRMPRCSSCKILYKLLLFRRLLLFFLLLPRSDQASSHGLAGSTINAGFGRNGYGKARPTATTACGTGSVDHVPSDIFIIISTT